MLNVLVLNDDPDELETLARGLLHLGIKCTCVRSADAAAAALRSGSVALLLADVTTPSRARLAADVAASHDHELACPVLVVAGLVVWPLASALLERGATLLRKPFTPDQLGQAIQLAISKGERK